MPVRTRTSVSALPLVRCFAFDLRGFTVALLNPCKHACVNLCGTLSVVAHAAAIAATAASLCFFKSLVGQLPVTTDKQGLRGYTAASIYSRGRPTCPRIIPHDYIWNDVPRSMPCLLLTELGS